MNGSLTGSRLESYSRNTRWTKRRRDQNVVWVSELFRADGITLRDRFMANLVARV